MSDVFCRSWRLWFSAYVTMIVKSHGWELKLLSWHLILTTFSGISLEVSLLFIVSCCNASLVSKSHVDAIIIIIKLKSSDVLMALKQILFQFWRKCPYWLCVESQISRQTVLNVGPRDHKALCPKFSVHSSDSEATDTADRRCCRLAIDVTGAQSRPDMEAPVNADTCGPSPPACTWCDYGLEASGVYAGQVWCGQTSWSLSWHELLHCEQFEASLASHHSHCRLNCYSNLCAADKCMHSCLCCISCQWT